MSGSYSAKRQHVFGKNSGFYGQISKITHLPVIEGRLLRANLKNRRFARNRGLSFTGRFQKSPICP
ncbi:MAG: vitamin B12-binding protein [Lactobacillus ruminis]|nr:vitamin B12-binding protein [Ligilactobacillus ruminis]